MKKIFILVLFLNILILIYTQDNSTDNSLNKNNSSNNFSAKSEQKSEQKKDRNGWELYLEGRYYESIKALEIEKKYHPERINIYVIEGWDYKYLGNFIDMEKVSLEGLKLDAEDSRIIINLGEAYYLQNKYSEAIPVFEKYLSKRYNINDQSIQKIYYFLGDCFYNLKFYRKADIALSTAYHFIKNDVQIILKLAFVKENLTEKNKSIELLKQVLNIEPNNNLAKESLSRLEK